MTQQEALPPDAEIRRRRRGGLARLRRPSKRAVTRSGPHRQSVVEAAPFLALQANIR